MTILNRHPTLTINNVNFLHKLYTFLVHMDLEVCLQDENKVSFMYIVHG